MKTFKQHILEKLKVDTNKNSDPRDYERLGDLSDLDTGNNFLYYVYDCLKRDKAKNGGSGFYFGPTKGVISIIYSNLKRKIKYSPDETYIELYDRILNVLREKHLIMEKLKVSTNDYKEYTFKTDKVNINKYNTDKFNDYFLGNTTMDLFEDYWYCMLQEEDQAYIENNDIHYDDIYLDYNGAVYVYDNNTGDEILRSLRGSAYYFIGAYDTILEYFENKNS